MALQIVEPCGRSAAREISGAGEQHARGLGDLARQQRRVGEPSDADGEVVAALGDVDALVVAIQRQLDLGIGLRERHQRPHEIEPAEGQRCRHPERSAQRAVLAAGFLHGDVELGEDLLGPPVEGEAGVGGARQPRRAADQLRADRLLQVGQPLGNHRFGQPQPLGRGRQAARLHHCHQGRQGFELGLHCSLPKNFNFAIGRLPRTMERCHVCCR